MDKDTRKILEAAQRQGFTVTKSKKGYALIHKDGEFVTKAAQTPSDYRGQRNLVAALRRFGFIWPPRK